MKRVFLAETQLLARVLPPVTLFENNPAPYIGVIALDEVGRGSLAGAVVTGASVWCLQNMCETLTRTQCNTSRDVFETKLKQKWVRKVDDSKALSPQEREHCFGLIASEFSHLHNYRVSDCEQSAVCYDDLRNAYDKPTVFNFEKRSKIASQTFSCLGIELGSATVGEIETHNIWGAVQLGFGRALTKLAATLQQLSLSPEQFLIVVDGKLGVKVPKLFASCQQVTSIGGDALFVSIGCSSVVAKVVRDQYMCELSRQGSLAPYGFDGHKGYATPLHCDAIRRHGASLLHRQGFLSNFL